MDLFDSSWLFASLIWGSIGVGYCIYGKRQESLPSFIAGLLMIVASYFVPSALVMSLACVALMVAVIVVSKRGW